MTRSGWAAYAASRGARRYECDAVRWLLSVRLSGVAGPAAAQAARVEAAASNQRLRDAMGMTAAAIEAVDRAEGVSR